MLSNRNQSIALQSKSISWFLYDGNFGFQPVKALTKQNKTNAHNVKNVSIFMIVVDLLSCMVFWNNEKLAAKSNDFTVRIMMMLSFWANY